VVVAEQCRLETIFGWIKSDGTRPGRAIQTMNGFALDSSQVYRVVESADDTVITRVPSMRHKVNEKDDGEPL
jgi:hypothetical protein